MRSIFSFIFVSFFLLTACSPVQQTVENSPSVGLPDLGNAPELTNTVRNHFPEFDRETVLSNLEQAVKDLKIPYAVAEDNLGATWKAYETQYWPSLYLIDKRGHIRYTHFGEGKYQETEDAIVSLLNEKGN